MLQRYWFPPGPSLCMHTLKHMEKSFGLPGLHSCLCGLVTHSSSTSPTIFCHTLTKYTRYSRMLDHVGLWPPRPSSHSTPSTCSPTPTCKDPIHSTGNDSLPLDYTTALGYSGPSCLRHSRHTHAHREHTHSAGERDPSDLVPFITFNCAIFLNQSDS